MQVPFCFTLLMLMCKPFYQSWVHLWFVKQKVRAILCSAASVEKGYKQIT